MLKSCSSSNFEKKGMECHWRQIQLCVRSGLWSLAATQVFATDSFKKSRGSPACRTRGGDLVADYNVFRRNIKSGLRAVPGMRIVARFGRRILAYFDCGAFPVSPTVFPSWIR